jgi:hypothetical protein
MKVVKNFHEGDCNKEDFSDNSALVAIVARSNDEKVNVKMNR